MIRQRDEPSVLARVAGLTEQSAGGTHRAAISKSRRKLVVVDTAPTGYTLLLDTTGSYTVRSRRQVGMSTSRHR
ncbi:hypothetical protein MI149_29645 (plasmid) [Mycolicibacterium crocinum]|uniref:Uncharacterized protein n=1 Tax=Mycolicibacterium crocinum TaxID=388459 RepID=A0ABY3TTS9_9MYCO|nr:hypothetical protein [Mycolicibacterium crocinum]ULN44844.1 hypothetical protein MI149_29645 [Mycolicibacterium crocinum]